LAPGAKNNTHNSAKMPSIAAVEMVTVGRNVKAE
jgi:hypothetical protein